MLKIKSQQINEPTVITRSCFTNRFLLLRHFYQPKKVIRIKAKNLKLLVIANRRFVLPDDF